MQQSETKKIMADILLLDQKADASRVKVAQLQQSEKEWMLWRLLHHDELVKENELLLEYFTSISQKQQQLITYLMNLYSVLSEEAYENEQECERMQQEVHQLKTFVDMIQRKYGNNL